MSQFEHELTGLACALTAGLVLAGCSTGQPPPPPAPIEAECTLEELETMAARVEELEGRIAELENELGELERQASAAQMQLLERDGSIADLERRLTNQRLVLDETINEVVRTKAKLRGAESRAEAVSQMAEAEIALQGLADLPGGSATEEYTKAAELMEASGRALDDENYGGAIYLVSQAKTLISQGMTSTATADIELSADEVRFQRPFRLRTLANSNVRSGPGLEYRVITTLPAGTSLVSHSYKGDWIHVRLEDGRDGWIFRPLVGSAPASPPAGPGENEEP